MRKLITILAAIIFCTVTVLPAHALDFDSFRADVSWGGAPEGTAYLDILIDLPKSHPQSTQINPPPRRISKGYLDTPANAGYA